jgi:hypothetical protein
VYHPYNVQDGQQAALVRLQHGQYQVYRKCSGILSYVKVFKKCCVLAQARDHKEGLEANMTTI